MYDGAVNLILIRQGSHDQVYRNPKVRNLNVHFIACGVGIIYRPTAYLVFENRLDLRSPVSRI
jgi:hypothetical protein